MSGPDLLVERANGVLRLTFNRPQKRNALNWTIRRALLAELASARHDVGIRVVVLGGDASAFCAGGDVAEMGGGTDEISAMLDAGDAIVSAIRLLPRPVVAALRGHVAGAAIGIALACDLVFADRSTTFTPSFARLGIGPDLSASYWLPRQVGLLRAKGFLLGGRPIDAVTAAESGMVTELWESEDFERLLAERVTELATGPTLAYAAMKQLLNDSLDRTAAEQAEREKRAQLDLVQSADHLEGVAAFVERRPARFRGA